MFMYKFTGIPFSSSQKKKKKKVDGYMLAPDIQKATEYIKTRKKISVIKISKVDFLQTFFTKVDDREKALFFEGFGRMIKSAISPSSALDNLINSEKNIKMIEFMYKLKGYLEEGKPLPEAMANTKFFDPDVIEMLKMGEESGRTVTVMQNLSAYFTQQSKIKKVVKSAVRTPIAVIIIAFVLLLFVAPMLINPMKSMFSQFKGVEFPKLTLMVMDTVNFISSNLIILSLIFIGLFFLFKHQYNNNYAFKKQIHKFLLFFPITKQFIIKLSNYKFMMAMSILYSAGVPAQRGLQMIYRGEKNIIIKEEYNEMIEYISQGGDFSKAIEESEFMPDMAKTLIKIGEKSGELEDIFINLTFITQESFDLYAEKVKAMMKPISGAIIGLMVGIIIIAIYMPIISMMDIAAKA